MPGSTKIDSVLLSVAAVWRDARLLARGPRDYAPRRIE
jgi:hypothetical protein